MSHYSQSEEDLLFQRLLKGGSLPKQGTILDIGAFDGVTFSNSRSLIEQGWFATLIEPSPYAFRELLELYGNNQNVRLINAALGLDNTMIPFHEGGLYGTTNLHNRDRWSSTVKYRRSYWVPQVTPAMFVNQFGGAPEILSIDTEGNSFELLKAFPVDSWVPWLIIVEHDSRIVEIASWARKKNYRTVDVNAENLILVASHADIRL